MPRFGRSNPGQGFGGPRYPGTFLLALREAFARQNWQGLRWLGPVVECQDAEGREQVVGLDNLYRRVRHEDRARWPDLLADYLANVPTEALDDPPADLNAVAERILVRLGPPFGPQDADARLWSRPLVADHVALTLVVDYPQSMAYVTEQMIAESGRPAEHWLDVALNNLHALKPEACFQVVHDESGLLQSEVGDAYDSSRALILDRLLPDHAGDGFLVALPGRDHLLVLPVNAGSIASLPWLKAVAARTHRVLPYPISSELFWVRQGDWFHFPIEVQGERVVLHPPPEFEEVLERLVPQEPDEGEPPDDEPLSI